jgi:hypothetical protein
MVLPPGGGAPGGCGFARGAAPSRRRSRRVGGGGGGGAGGGDGGAGAAGAAGEEDEDDEDEEDDDGEEEDMATKKGEVFERVAAPSRRPWAGDLVRTLSYTAKFAAARGGGCPRLAGL